MEKVNGFTLNQNTPGDVCNKIVNEIKSAYDTIMEPMLLPLAFTGTQATDYAKIEREAKGYHATMKAESEKLVEFISQARREAEAALTAVKEQAAEAGVSTNADIFLKDSEAHSKQAGKWMTATIWISAITLVIAAGAFIVSFLYHPPSVATAVQYVVSKLILFSVLSFGVFWCVRNYKSQKHNEILNRHRANALRTFRAFVEGTADDRVKDAILLHAAQAAFRSRPTGFDSPESDSAVVNPIVDVIGRNLSKVIPSSGGGSS